MADRDDLHVLVAVRIRPDRSVSNMHCAKVVSNSNQIGLTAPTRDQIRTLRSRIRRRSRGGHFQAHSHLLTRSNSAVFQKNKMFRYDRVYGPPTSQDQLYDEMGTIILQNCLDGFNATLFAYGQTGSGKTHTLFGPDNSNRDQDRGIIPRLCSDLFEQTERIVSQSQIEIATATAASQDAGGDGASEEKSPTDRSNGDGDGDSNGDSDSDDTKDGGLNAELRQLHSKKPRVSFTIQASMIEIYNEKIRDLLNPTSSSGSSSSSKKGLSLREHPTLGWFIPELTRIDVSRASQIDEVISVGSRNRTIAKTRMNDTSSRAHTIVQLRVIRTEEFLTRDGSSVLYTSDRSSLVNLVDLAGSEQMATSVGKHLGMSDGLGHGDYSSSIGGGGGGGGPSSGPGSSTGPGTGGGIKNIAQREKELISINVSLSALGMVITKLARMFDGDRSVTHIPYRDSKLTKLLMDSLGGNSRTVMIATISPNPLHFDQTVSTCRYAHRVKSIRNRPIVNQDPKEKIIAELRKKIKELMARQGSFSESDTRTLQELKGLNELMTRDMEDMSKRHQEEVSMHLSQHSYLRNRNMGLEKRLASMKARESDLLAELAAMEQKLSTHEERPEIDPDDMDALRAENDALRKENGELRRMLKTALDDNSSLRSKWTDYESRIESWKEANRLGVEDVMRRHDGIVRGLNDVNSFVRQLDAVVISMYTGSEDGSNPAQLDRGMLQEGEFDRGDHEHHEDEDRSVSSSPESSFSSDEEDV